MFYGLRFSVDNVCACRHVTGHVSFWNSAIFSRLAVSAQLEFTINSAFFKLFYISTRFLPLSISANRGERSWRNHKIKLLNFLTLCLSSIHFLTFSHARRRRIKVNFSALSVVLNRLLLAPLSRDTIGAVLSSQCSLFFLNLPHPPIPYIVFSLLSSALFGRLL